MIYQHYKHLLARLEPLQEPALMRTEPLQTGHMDPHTHMFVVRVQDDEVRNHGRAAPEANMAPPPPSSHLKRGAAP